MDNSAGMVPATLNPARAKARKENMKTFIQAVAQMEGFGASPSNIPTSRNNPGDIEEGRFAQSHGALPPDGHRFAAWPTPDAGFAAMRALLTSAYLGLTVQAALAKWAPPVENNVSAYLHGVCEMTGLTPDTVLTPELIG
jgi:hypothetical protein